MTIETESEELAAFILRGEQVGDKWLSRLGRDKTFMKNLTRVIGTLAEAESTAKLHAFRSLNYERLAGNRAGQSSVRIGFSSPYRLIFTEHDGGIRILVIEISNHYDSK